MNKKVSSLNYINEGYIIEIMPGYKNGANSTMFTECCGVAICDDEKCCPRCGRNVIGCDAETNGERNKIRWKSFTRFWEK